MGRLVTLPSTPNPSRYIRGHLLNHNFGGEGKDFNMFPITAEANSNHLHQVENTIRGWIDAEESRRRSQPSLPKHWVRYEVKVAKGNSRLNAGDPGGKDPRNYVNSTFVCIAELKEAGGQVIQRIPSTRIRSVYRPPG